MPQPSSPMPTVRVNAQVSQDAYKQLNVSGASVLSKRTILANADTGATVCVAGMTLLEDLGLDTKCLVPVSIRLWSANKTPLKVIGGIFLDISSKSKHTLKAIHTKQLTYIAETVTSLFLSRDALSAMR